MNISEQTQVADSLLRIDDFPCLLPQDEGVIAAGTAIESVGFKGFLQYQLQQATPMRAERHSLFHLKRSKNDFALLDRQTGNASGGWVFALLLVMLLLVVRLTVRFRLRIGQLWKGCWSVHKLNQGMRDGLIFNERIFFPIVLLHLFSISFLVYEGTHYFGGDIRFFDREVFNYLSLVAVITIFVLLKNLFAVLIGGLFATSTVFYIVSTWSHNTFLSLLLFPLFPLFFYSNLDKGVILFILFGIVGVFFLLRVLRGFVAALKYTHFSRIYLFLYLCTAEILPLLLIGKYVSTL